MSEEGEDSGEQIIDRSDAEWIVDNDKIWLKLEAKLRDSKLVPDAAEGKYKFVPEMGPYPYMNKAGISRTMAFFVGCVNQITSTGNLDRTEIYNLSKNFRKELGYFFYRNAQEFGMNRSRFLPLVDMLAGLYFVNLTKSLGGKTGELILSGTRRIESTHETSQSMQGQGGFMPPRWPGR